MKITKLGHCCLLIEEQGVRILTDPGSYSIAQNEAKDIDVVLITHEHSDHLHVDSLKAVLKNNPDAQVITNSSVGVILSELDIKYLLIKNKDKVSIKDIAIEGFEINHAIIQESLPAIKNTGYFINNKLFYPGDSFYNPQRPVDVLALPVAGPWLKISEAIDYAKEINPKACFPVHEGMLKEGRVGAAHKIPDLVLNSLGIKFVIIEEGKTEEF